MDKYTFMTFLRVFTFGVITAILFLGGTLGVYFTVKHMNRIRTLEKFAVTEGAVIARIELRSRTINNTIYFVPKDEEKTYKMNLIKVHPGKIKAGDEIKVKFNEDRTLFLITTYQSAVYIGYIFEIVLFVVCFVLSIFFLLGTIELYKKG